jgi:TRAP-type C4-dicarboxylate transport system permease large subunit
VNVGQTVIRIGLTLFLLYRSYAETGPYTAIILFLLCAANELNAMIVKRKISKGVPHA